MIVLWPAAWESQGVILDQMKDSSLRLGPSTWDLFITSDFIEDCTYALTFSLCLGEEFNFLRKRYTNLI
jgi:hypothetical protein